MESEGRPEIHALVGFYCEPYGLITKPRWMSLEEAVDFSRFGFVVLVDPQDERDLAMYERLERATAPQPKTKWFDRS